MSKAGGEVSFLNASLISTNAFFLNFEFYPYRKVICPLSTTQLWWYKALLVKDLNILADGGKGKAKVLNNLVMQLRKCCLHPFLFPGVEDDPDETSLNDLIGNSGKLAVLDLLLMSLFKKGHRVTLFSQFTSVLDILDDYCRLRGWKYCRFDGGTARARRNHIINSFNAEGSDTFIFLMSTRSGGMGINLQTADTCILYDSDWSKFIFICLQNLCYNILSHCYCSVTQTLNRTSRR